MWETTQDTETIFANWFNPGLKYLIFLNYKETLLKNKSLKKISTKRVKVFKVRNRRSYAAICMNNLTEGSTAQQAIRRLTHPLRRMGYELV